MSFAANVGHSFADLLWHHGQVRPVRHVRPAAPEPPPERRPIDIDRAVTARRSGAEQRAASYRYSAGINR